MPINLRSKIARIGKWMVLVCLGIVIGLPLILILAYLGFLFVAAGFSPDFLAIDGCMDGGGCWDEIENVCRKDEVNAQELCNRSKPANSSTD